MLAGPDGGPEDPEAVHHVEAAVPGDPPAVPRPLPPSAPALPRQTGVAVVETVGPRTQRTVVELPTNLSKFHSAWRREGLLHVESVYIK